MDRPLLGGAIKRTAQRLAIYRHHAAHCGRTVNRCHRAGDETTLKTRYRHRQALRTAQQQNFCGYSTFVLAVSSSASKLPKNSIWSLPPSVIRLPLPELFTSSFGTYDYLLPAPYQKYSVDCGVAASHGNKRRRNPIQHPDQRPMAALFPLCRRRRLRRGNRRLPLISFEEAST